MQCNNSTNSPSPTPDPEPHSSNFIVDENVEIEMENSIFSTSSNNAAMQIIGKENKILPAKLELGFIIN